MVALGSSTLPNKLSIIFLGVRPLTKTSSDTSPAILFRGKYSLFQSLTAMSFKKPDSSLIKGTASPSVKNLFCFLDDSKIRSTSNAASSSVSLLPVLK